MCFSQTHFHQALSYVKSSPCEVSRSIRIWSSALSCTCLSGRVESDYVCLSLFVRIFNIQFAFEIMQCDCQLLIKWKFILQRFPFCCHFGRVFAPANNEFIWKPLPSSIIKNEILLVKYSSTRSFN